ncbi:MAG TPA: N-6 DNA methylase [Candidatus Cloacimonadota bacterium]|nr:N-6 DNA methylase [Candidatus Cloacimonadota bacterium]
MDIEKAYIDRTDLEHRKKFAQFFTPLKIAEFMTEWIYGGSQIDTILEPAFGLGVFTKCILMHNPNAKIVGYEIDNNIFTLAKEHFQLYDNITIKNKDFMLNDWDMKFSSIICNPPYLKFHNYNNKIVVDEVKNKIGIRFKSTSNLYAMFLTKSIYQLSENGRASFIIPTEFLNSDYGVDVKKFLLDNNVLRYVFVIDFNSMAFEKSMTTSTIFLLAKDIVDKGIVMKSINTSKELAEYKEMICSYSNNSSVSVYSKNELDPKVKWREYYEQNKPKKTTRLIPFTTFASIKRGIATGDNDYFTFNKTKALEYKIPPTNLLPCITKSLDVKKNIFNLNDFEKLVDEDKRVYLFDANESTNPAVIDYIKLGEERNVHSKFLTSQRKPWYKLEKRIAADLWVSVFNRNEAKFILNEAQILNLTTFHCVYIKDMNLEQKDLFTAYLLSDTAKRILEINRREYGNGLKKFEPNDIQSSMILDLNSISSSVKKQILELYRRFYKSEDDDLFNSYHIKEIDYLLAKEFDLSNNSFLQT